MVIQYFGASSERVDVLCICNICLPCLCSTMYPVYNLHTPLLNCSKICNVYGKTKKSFFGGPIQLPIHCIWFKIDDKQLLHYSYTVWYMYGEHDHICRVHVKLHYQTLSLFLSLYLSPILIRLSILLLQIGPVKRWNFDSFVKISS